MEIGASEGIRTLDIHLGKVTLYQTELRSLPKTREELRPAPAKSSADFDPSPIWQGGAASPPERPNRRSARR